MNHDERLLQRLKDKEFAVAYLTECLEENDPELFNVAMNQYMRAHGFSKVGIAKESNISRTTIYNMLDSSTSPTIDTFKQVLSAVGLKLVIDTKEANNDMELLA